LNEVEREIRTLATSSQQYDLVTNYSFPKTGTDIEYQGGFDYNTITKHAEIRVSGSKPSLGTFAHELKHAYQFETGTLSGPNSIIKDENTGLIIKRFYSLYDKEDEREAFERGRLFGLGETFERNESVYDHLPDSRDFSETIRRSKREEVHKWKHWSATVISPEVLHGYEQILRDPRTTLKEKEDAENKLTGISSRTHTAFRVNGKTYYKGRIIANRR
jgi:hypothetical protein